MKAILLAAFFSISATAAETCFMRTTELETNEVQLAKELCFAAVELELDVFSTSHALLRYSIDGNRAFKKVELRNGHDLGNGLVLFNFSLESSIAGGYCGDTWEARSHGTLIVKRDGSAAHVSTVGAEVNYSNDNCHSGMQTVQEFSYLRL